MMPVARNGIRFLVNSAFYLAACNSTGDNDPAAVGGSQASAATSTGAVASAGSAAGAAPAATAANTGTTPAAAAGTPAAQGGTARTPAAQGGAAGAAPPATAGTLAAQGGAAGTGMPAAPGGAPGTGTPAMQGGTAGMSAAPGGAPGSGTPAMQGGTAGMPAAPGGAPAGGATFTAVFNLLAGGCATGGYCHAAGGGTSKLALVDQAGAFSALVDVPAMGMAAPGSGKTGCAESMAVRVKAGDPDNSLLMQKLEGKQTCGDVMPPGGMLLPAELKLVRDWIEAGAKND